tara:strand:+ start:18564 stop:19715 length:1152 start_codon:yes stop_codon:yes gene_type:complete
LIKKIVFTAIAASLLVACAGTDDIDESLLPAELIQFDVSVDVEELWSVSIGSGADDTSSLLRPALLDDRIYVTDHDGRVSALDAANGRSQWSVNLRTSITGGTGVGEGLVLVASGEGIVYALEQSNGSIRWQVQLNSEVLAPPQAGSGVVIILAQDGSIYALDSQNGEQIWRVDAIKPLLTVRGNAQPAIVDDIVLIGHDSGKIGAYRLANGAALWIARVAVPEGSNELQRMVDIDAAPLYANGLVYGISFQGGIMAINPQTGRGTWFQETSSVNEIGVFGGTLSITDVGGKITAFNASSGELLWESEAVKNRGVTGPVVGDLIVAVADFEGYVHFFRRNTGTLANRLQVGRDAIRAPLVAIEDGLLVLDTSGRLTALRIGDL